MSQLSVLIRVYVRTFYVENASLFLLIIGLTCGFMSGVEHQALAFFFVSTPSAVLIPALIWAIYAIKISRFNRALFNRRENAFLTQLILFARRLRIVLISAVVLLQFMPAIVYGVFLVLTAVRTGSYQSLSVVLTFLILLSLLMIVDLNLSLVRREYLIRIRLPAILRLTSKFVRPYVLFPVEWTCRRLPGAFFGLKAFGLLLLSGIFYLYRFEPYDARLISMGIVIIAAMNTQLIFSIHQFENHIFTLTRHLPIPLSRRMLTTAIIFLVLFFPELAVVISSLPAGLSGWVLLEETFLLLSAAVLIYGVLFKADLGQENIVRRVFIGCMAVIVVILFNLSPWLIGIVNVAAGILLWQNNYYRFEFFGEKVNRG